ncbi:hypothetical protein [Alkaliphilus transvaalensis]|uniref:hypothetical protein n=1 Tax=Alkaliphilus transvaalensis TaxID=114628 RepID=UPI0004796D1A|nr:hypothetical protein [Alkaliphilus transvaalensis]
MAWTHKTRKNIEVYININNHQDEIMTCSEAEAKENIYLKGLIKTLQQECLQLALQNYQAKRNK